MVQGEQLPFAGLHAKLRLFASVLIPVLNSM